MTTETLSLSKKVNQLFITFHTLSEPEQTEASVARSVSTALGQIVPASQINALRAGRHDGDLDGVDSALLKAIATHFKVPPVYLTDTDVIAEAIDRELRLLAAARDVGARSIALRGSDLDNDALAQELTRIASSLPEVK
jgi:hypothetical protein